MDTVRANPFSDTMMGLTPGRHIEWIDAHVHTRHSDGEASVTDVEEVCLNQEVGCCITDHNEIRGTVRLWERRRVTSLPAIEVGSRERIELLLYFKHPQACEDFYKVFVEPHRCRRWYAYLPCTLNYLVSGAREFDTLIAFPHPYAPLWKNIRHGKNRRDTIDHILERTDCIEVINGSQTRRANSRAWKLCRRLSKTPLAGSDSHRVDTVGSVLAAVNLSEEPDSLFDALRGGLIQGFMDPGIRPPHMSNTWRLAKRHTQKFIHPGGVFINRSHQ